MTKYAKAWENKIKALLDSGKLTEADLEEHLRHITWLQHERLIHLIVMVFVAVLMMTSFILIFFIEHVLMIAVFTILFVLVCFYVQHYFFLENTVQRWYRLADAIVEAIRTNGL